MANGNILPRNRINFAVGRKISDNIGDRASSLDSY